MCEGTLMGEGDRAEFWRRDGWSAWWLTSFSKRKTPPNDTIYDIEVPSRTCYSRRPCPDMGQTSRAIAMACLRGCFPPPYTDGR